MRKPLVARSFSRAGAHYREAAKVQRKVAQDCAANVPAGEYDRVIELGAGQGLLAQYLHGRISWKQYLGLDIAEGMLREAPDRAGNELAVVADGEELPLPEGCTDLLLSSSMFQWYRDPAHSLPANLRLLRPGGVFSFAMFVSGTLSELAAVSEHTGFGRVLPMRDEQEYLWSISGTPGIRCSELVWEVQESYASARDMLRQLKQCGFTGAGAGRAFPREQYLRFLQEYSRHYSQPDGSVRATWRVLFVWGERKPEE
ncbi:methyltransferase domain-containing protein [Desulfobaculum bizertense]|uniref:methyltransferase domain-containing protein n=1 Tax=Desulfobaculum bizertense TaxID=376490 RepID=UPI0013564E45|nr:methyltransferase domain-containing protein [Desulfobaculum bizertense]